MNALSLEDKGHLEGAAAVDSQIYQVNDGDSRQHNPHAIYAEMVVGGKAVKFQLDSGAACNLLPLSALPQGTSLQPSGKVLKTYNGATLATHGTAEVTLINLVTQQHHRVPFEALRGHHMPLLGVKAAQDLDLLTVNNNNFKRITSASAQPIPSTKHAILENYATVFADIVGTLPDPVYLRKDPGIHPVIMPARKLPLSMEEPVKAELTNLVSAGILEPVDKPTPWVSQMVVVVKPTGKVRIRLDPGGLNNALMRKHHTLPTLDSMLHKAQGARVFFKADLRHGYWHGHLDEESSDLTTMATPFSCYKWPRLPFGVNVPAEIFGKRVQTAFKDLKNIHCIADDVLICGYGITTEAASKTITKPCSLSLTGVVRWALYSILISLSSRSLRCHS